MKRKRPLLKNEIEMIQIILRKEGYPTDKYRERLAGRLEDLKELWYKVKPKKKQEDRKWNLK